MVDIYGTADDANLSSWVLQYMDHDVGGWAYIASGNASVDGYLGSWNTTGFKQCAYTLRLVVYDASIIGCDDPQRSEYTTSLNVGQKCPVLLRNQIISQPLPLSPP